MIRWQKGMWAPLWLEKNKTKSKLDSFFLQNSQVKPGQNQSINQELHPPDAKLMMHILLPVHTFNILAINGVLESSDAVRSYKLLSLWINVSTNDTGLVTDWLVDLTAGATAWVRVRNTRIQLPQSLPPRKLWIFLWKAGHRAESSHADGCWCLSERRR